MVRSCVNWPDAQQGVQLVPEAGNELAALIRDDLGGNAEPGDPVPKKSPGTVFSHHGDQWDRLYPPRIPVNDRKKVRVPL